MSEGPQTPAAESETTEVLWTSEDEVGSEPPAENLDETDWWKYARFPRTMPSARRFALVASALDRFVDTVHDTSFAVPDTRAEMISRCHAELQTRFSSVYQTSERARGFVGERAFQRDLLLTRHDLAFERILESVRFMRAMSRNHEWRASRLDDQQIARLNENMEVMRRVDHLDHRDRSDHVGSIVTYLELALHEPEDHGAGAFSDEERETLDTARAAALDEIVKGNKFRLSNTLVSDIIMTSAAIYVTHEARRFLRLVGMLTSEGGSEAQEEHGDR